jgi:hypothetical protein
MPRREVVINRGCLRAAQTQLDRASKKLQRISRSDHLCPNCRKLIQEVQWLIDGVWEHLQFKLEDSQR